MKTIEEALKRLRMENINEEVLDESQSSEIRDIYQDLSAFYNVELEELIYGRKGFMKTFYPNGFDVSADIIFLEDKWNEFEKWVKETKGIDFKAIRQKENANRVKEDIDYEKLKKQIDNQPITPIKYSRIWNPDFYLKKEPQYEEVRNAIKKALWNLSLTPEEITLSVYGSIIRFNKNVKLDTAQMKTLVNKVLAKINPALKAEKLRSMAGKVTFDITGYEYLKDHITEDNFTVIGEKISNKDVEDTDNVAKDAEASKLPYGELSWKMGEVISAMNNEDAYFDSGWLYVWPDEQTEEACLKNFNDKESYDDLKAMFKEVYTDYHEDGLYTNKKRIVDFAHEMDKKFNLPLIKNFKDIKESVDNDNNNYALQISVESGLSADGADISVFQDGNVIHKKNYRYGYDASYSKSNDPSKPYISDIIQDYILKYNITEDNFTVVAGMNVFKGEKVSNKDVEYFKTKYCNNLVFNDTDNVAKDVKAAVLTEIAGGEANGMTVEDIAKKHNVTVEDIEKQLEIGIQIEQEHTSDPEHAKKIAMDHLVEFSDYYDRLVKMEKDAEEGKTLEEEAVTEKYSKEELDDMIGDVHNIQKISNIFRRKKYDEKRLFAHTVCTKCGREKTVFLSNLINDPDKYGSCVCSDTNIEAKIDSIQDLYSGKKKLANNTSGYTGVSFVKTFKGEPYNKWRAYIEIDGVRTYLGDFTSKAKAVKARKEAGEKGIKWYKDNRNKLIRDVRRKSKKYKTSKYRETQKTRKYKRGIGV